MIVSLCGGASYSSVAVLEFVESSLEVLCRISNLEDYIMYYNLFETIRIERVEWANSKTEPLQIYFTSLIFL